MDYRDNRQRWAESHQVVHFYAGQWCTFTPALTPMTSKCTAQLLADLGVTRSLSRPQVSDDNPFSEAQFKTLKYHPGFPGRFEDCQSALNIDPLSACNVDPFGDARRRSYR